MQSTLFSGGKLAMSRSEGIWGEALAADYIRERGYELVAHSYRCRFGEIDLIAWDKDVLCFIEVKTRTNTQMGLPREYVTPVKQSRIRKTALFYLADNDLDCPARFDVAEVYADAPGDEKSVRIEYLEDAFQ
jgi:putative endonuclease